MNGKEKPWMGHFYTAIYHGVDSYQYSCPEHPGYSHPHTWPWEYNGMTPGCFGTQILGHSYGYQSHTHQYLDEEITAELSLNTLWKSKTWFKFMLSTFIVSPHKTSQFNWPLQLLLSVSS